MQYSAPSNVGHLGVPPVAIRICFAVTILLPIPTLLLPSSVARPWITSTLAPPSMRSYMPFNRSISLVLLSRNVGQSKLPSTCCQPNPFAASKCSANSEAYTNNFLGTQPTLTHVPPINVSSATATFAPRPAAIRLARTPPEPAPITKKS